MAKPTAVVVDATYELFRMWFGAPPKTSPQGEEVGAVRAVLGSLAHMLREEKVTHVGCATDRVIESFRNELFAGYKTGAGIDPELFGQFALLEEGIEAMGIKLWPMVELEADDGLASAVARYKDQAEKILIATVDKDLAQCVDGDHVVMLDRRRGNKVMNEAGVVEKFGVPPKLVPDLLALVGDSADGYPGIAGFGMKSSAAVLNEYGSIEAIPADGATWTVKVRGAKKLADKLASEREEALLYKTLATLRTDGEMEPDIDAIRWRGPRAELSDFCTKHGFPDLVERVPSHG